MQMAASLAKWPKEMSGEVAEMRPEVFAEFADYLKRDAFVLLSSLT